nr:hypothetical protein [Tanacetum cinerariifolium]
DDESLSDEDVPEDNFKIYSNPLFEIDDECISSDVNSIFDEVLENIDSKDSYDSNLNESDLLVTLLFDDNENECFDSGGDVDEINDFMDSYYDSEGDILYLESLLNDDLVHRDPSIPAMSVASILEGFIDEPPLEENGDDVELLLHRDPSTPIMSIVSILEGFTDEPPLEENDDLFDLESKKNDWKKILCDTSIDDLMTEDKVFDPGIHDQFFSVTYVSLPFEDRHYLFLTYVVRIFLPHFTYPVDSPFLLSSGSEDTIFYPGISAFHFSHRSGTFISFNVYPKILNANPMEICSSTCFNPNITMIW